MSLRPNTAGRLTTAIFYYSRNRSGEHPARHLAGLGAGLLIVEATCPVVGQQTYRQRSDHRVDRGSG